jgi:uncharacterized protein YdeI (YjbR/CyaY-like superfamily)
MYRPRQSLTEEIKWGLPVYTLNGKNVVNIGALRESCTLGFFKGALMSDPHNILKHQANIQQSRVIYFTSMKVGSIAHHLIKQSGRN